MTLDDALEGLNSTDTVTQTDTIRSLPGVSGAHLSVEIFSALGRIYKKDPDSALGQAAQQAGFALMQREKQHITRAALLRRPAPESQPHGNRHP
jgi:hypothetical protein